nr:hypothetical protein [Rhodococcus opacus]
MSGQRRVEHSRCDGIDRHVVLRKLLAQRFGQSYDTGLRGDIRALVHVAFLCSDGGEVEDSSTTLPPHMLDHFAAAQVRTCQVHVDHLMPHVEWIDFGKSEEPLDSGTVHQDVDPPWSRTTARTAFRTALWSVMGELDCLMAAPARQRMEHSIPLDHLGPFRRQAVSDSLLHSATPACDDRYRTGESRAAIAMGRCPFSTL